jgi:hypothetical protein
MYAPGLSPANLPATPKSPINRPVVTLASTTFRGNSPRGQAPACLPELLFFRGIRTCGPQSLAERLCAAYQEAGSVSFDFQGHPSDVFDLDLSEFAFEPGDGSAEFW